MHCSGKCFHALFISASLFVYACGAQQPLNMDAPTAAQQALDFPTVLYGAAYYNEYMPGDQDARLEKDIALMKAAG